MQKKDKITTTCSGMLIYLENLKRITRKAIRLIEVQNGTGRISIDKNQ